MPRARPAPALHVRTAPEAPLGLRTALDDLLPGARDRDGVAPVETQLQTRNRPRSHRLGSRRTRAVAAIGGLSLVICLLAWNLYFTGDAGSPARRLAVNDAPTTTPTASGDTDAAATATTVAPTTAPGPAPTLSGAATMTPVPPGEVPANLQASLAAAKLISSTAGSYNAVTPQALAAAAPSMTFVPATQAAGRDAVSVQVVNDTSLLLVAMGPDGACQAAFDTPEGLQVFYTPQPCDAASLWSP